MSDSAAMCPSCSSSHGNTQIHQPPNKALPEQPPHPGPHRARPWPLYPLVYVRQLSIKDIDAVDCRVPWWRTTYRSTSVGAGDPSPLEILKSGQDAGLAPGNRSGGKPEGDGDGVPAAL